MTLQRRERGDLLIREGTHSDGLWLLVEGTLQVMIGRKQDGEGGTDVEVCRVVPGEWVGELSLLDPGPATATVRCVEECILLHLTQDAFEALVRDDPAVGRKLVRSFGKSLARRLRAHSTHLLQLDGGVTHLAEAPRARGWISRLFGGITGGESA